MITFLLVEWFHWLLLHGTADGLLRIARLFCPQKLFIGLDFKEKEDWFWNNTVLVIYLLITNAAYLCLTVLSFHLPWCSFEAINEMLLKGHPATPQLCQGFCLMGRSGHRASAIALSFYHYYYFTLDSHKKVFIALKLSQNPSNCV